MLLCPRLHFQVRGLDGTKEASVVIKPHPEGPLHNKEAVTVNIAVANGLGEQASEALTRS